MSKTSRPNEASRYVKKGREMKKEEILEKCQMDMEECLVDMGNQQKLLSKLRETGFYDTSVLLEAMGKIAELRQKLDSIEGELKEISDTTENK